MQVTHVKSMLVDPGSGKNWLFVKVDTDAGISGWGECYTQADRDQAIVAHIQQLGRYLVGRDPFHIKHFTYMAYHDFAGKRGAMDFYEEFHPFWYEEPVSARNLDALAACKREIRLPVVTGEELYTKAEFREVFEKQAADIINPDVCTCGGILELKEIAAMAEPYFVVVSPHNYNSTTIGLAATLQVAACIPNFLITEYFVNFQPRGDEVAVSPFRVENSYITLPTSPGLGLELKEEVLARYPYREFPARSLRRAGDEGP